jgi:hypothetical protein
MKSQDGYIFGHPIDNILSVVNVAYLLAVGFAAILSVAIFWLAAQSSAAKDRALDAYKKSADLQIAQANSNAKMADEKAALAIKAAAEANERAAALAVEAEQLKLELAKRTAPLVARRLTTAQAQTLVAKLTGTGLRVNVFSTGSDLETNGFLEDILSVLRTANVLGGQMTGGSVTTGGVTAVPDGLNITGPNDWQTATLEAAFTAAGVPFGKDKLSIGRGVSLMGGIGTGAQLTITIGPRPNLPTGP